MKKPKKTTFIKIAAYIIVFAVVFCSLFMSSGRIMREYALKNYNAVITSVTYDAFDSVLSGGLKDFSSLVKIDKNSDGEIIYIGTDSFGVNKIASEISKAAQKLLNEKTKEGVGIPLGAFTGIRILSGFGQKVRMKLLSVSAVKTEIVSSFTQAGINQTRHTLTLNLRCETSLVARPVTETVVNEVALLIYDNLIVGKVPSVLVSPMIVGKG